MEHFSNGAILKSNISQMEQFSNGAFWGRHHQLDDSLVGQLTSCSPELEEHKKIEVMEEFAKMLRRSGYSEKFRFEVISDAVQGYQKMVKRENEGGQPVNRPKDFEEERGKEDKVVQERTTRY